MANHYIRIGERNVVVYAFSDAFEQPEKLDVCIGQGVGRHCDLELRTETGGYRYRWDVAKRELVEQTPDEIEPLDDLKARLKANEDRKARLALVETDIVAQQYLEQISAGVSPAMSDTDFATLVGKREEIREAMDTAKASIDKMTTRASLEARE